MANLAAIKKRIKSTKSTQQITKAMKMVAAAKLRGAEERLRSARPYAITLDEVIARLYRRSEMESYDLITGREEVKKIEYLIVTSDRGLCAGFNSSIIRHAMRQLAEVKGKYEQTTVSFVGRKAFEFFKRRPFTIRKSYVNLLRDFDFPLAQRVGQELTQAYRDGEVDEIHLIYNEFVTAISQRIVTKRLIPVQIPEPKEGVAEDMIDFKYEPDKEAVLRELLPRQVNFQLYRAFLESFAAEMGARMNAMDSATKNAGEMIDRLTLLYNRRRQAAITVELMEIINGAEALKG